MNKGQHGPDGGWVVGNKITTDEITTDDETTVVDGGGRVLTPGFIDCHTHVAFVGPFDKLENEFDGVYVASSKSRR
jgi:imidazolonepropionase-like amidohydrolase